MINKLRPIVITCKDCLNYETCPKVTEMVIQQFGADNHVSELCRNFNGHTKNGVGKISNKYGYRWQNSHL